MAGTEEPDYGGYRIVRELGSGGMGTVYLARHPRLPREDALKVLSDTHRDDEGFRARFLREAEIAARLQHPNLVAVRDRGEADGRLWIAMQFVDGIDCAELLRRGPVAPERAVWILGEAARGLDEVHRAGLLHRDVKPANILIAEQSGAADRVLVTDFGIARPADDSDTLDGASGFTGTVAYAAPEQISGGTVDHRTDVYALGCTLYQLLTGVPPFRRDSPGAIMYAHLHEPPPRASEEKPGIPPGLDAVIAIAMAKDPADRFQSCEQFAAAALEVLTVTVLSGAAPVRHTRRRALLAGAALVTAIVMGAALTVFVRSGSGDAAAGANAPNTTGVDPLHWGAYAFVAETFPDLLPPFTYGIGYQGMNNCLPTEYGGQRVVSFEDPVKVGHLLCFGDRDPAEMVLVMCNTDRSPLLPQYSTITRLAGDESWTRPRGKGHLFWGTTSFAADDPAPVLAGRTFGVLEVYFEDPGRSHCRIEVTGSVSGPEIRDRWWPRSPL